MNENMNYFKNNNNELFGYTDEQVANGLSENLILISIEEVNAIQDAINQTKLDTLTYSEKRKNEYSKLNQFEMQFDDRTNGTTTWVDAINAIKAKYPKPE